MSKECKLCGGINVKTDKITCTSRVHKGKSLNFQICLSCGFSFAPDNVQEYTDKNKFNINSLPTEEVGRSVRAGNGLKPGREFMLAKHAIQILSSVNPQKTKPNVLIFGCGLSRDFELLIKSGLVEDVRVTDVKNFNETDVFIELTDNSIQFDIIICSEVIEHFTDIKNDFENLIKKLDFKGLLVCTTNINDFRMGIEKSEYAFTKGHTAYYSGRGLMELLGGFNLMTDFRNLDGSQLELGPRKKVIFSFYENKFYPAISEFFSRYWLFPSEKTNA